MAETSAVSDAPTSTEAAAPAAPHAQYSDAERRRNLVLIFTANFISGFAQGITLISIPWHIVSVMQAPELNAQILGTIQVVVVGWGLYSGTLIDKYNRKHLFLTINAVGAAVLGLSSLYGHLVGDYPALVLGGIVLTTYLIFTIHYPNLYAFLQELFPPKLYGRVNSGIELQGQFTNAVGMATGAILLDGTREIDQWPAGWHIDAWPLADIFLMNSITYLAAFSVISFILYRMRPREPSSRMPVVDRVKLGIDYLRQHIPLLVFGLASYSIFFCTLTFFPVVLPTYIENVLNESGKYMGLSESVFAAGALVAGVFGLVYGRKMAPTRILPVITVILGGGVLMLAYLALAPSVWTLLTMAAVFGLLNSGARILRITFLLKAVPNYVIGRVGSIMAITNGFLRAVFILLIFPYALDFDPATQARGGIGIQALIVLISVLSIVLAYPKLRDLARRSDTD